MMAQTQIFDRQTEALLRENVQRARSMHEAMRQAAHTRRTEKTLTGFQPLDRKHLDRIRLDEKELGLALDLVRAGRDPENVRQELLTCFDKKGRHKKETLTKRLFKIEGHVNYDKVLYVEKVLNELRKDGEIFEEYHKRTYEDVYLLATPARIKERQLRIAERKRREAERKAEDARQKAVLSTLKEAYGVEARAPRYGSGVLLTLEQAEKLLGMKD